MKHKPRQIWPHGIIVAPCYALLDALAAYCLPPRRRRPRTFAGWKSAPQKSRWTAAPAACKLNVEFLQQTLNKLAHDTQDKLAATDRDLSAAQAEIATLKAAVEKLNGELAQMKTKPEPSSKK